MGMRYHHIGYPVTKRVPGEVHLKDLKIFASGYGKNPFGIERIRFEKDAPYPEIVKTLPHIAFEVDDLQEAIKNQTILIQPNSPSPGILVAFIEVDGVPVELLQIDHSTKDAAAMDTEITQRITDPNAPPTLNQLESWLGKTAYAYWRQVESLIDRQYPGVFSPEWLYGGKKHGWSLRYKKSKSFCTLIPEKGRCLLMIIFGAQERMGVEAIRSQLSPMVLEAYDQATSYHDGKWLLLEIRSVQVLADAGRLLTVKRKPKLVAGS